MPSNATHPIQQTGRAAELVAVIAHERVQAIVWILLQRELCVCELRATFDWPQRLISPHLGVLRKSGLVRDRRDARWVYYSLIPERLAELREALGFLLGVSGMVPEASYGATQRCWS